MSSGNYIIACIHDWNIENFEKHFSNQENITLITKKDDLTLDKVKEINPKYIFFPHWSWIVPTELVDNYECVNFHMTDLPYGQGGSPLQNLIIRGHKETKISALKMSEKLDAGPIYMKVDLDLEGRAIDIYKRASDKIYDLIKKIMSEEPKATEQSGEATEFVRRKPEQSLINEEIGTIEALYDFVRMLDAPGYPLAFMDHNGFKISFSEATLENGNTEIEARVKIQLNKNGE